MSFIVKLYYEEKEVMSCDWLVGLNAVKSECEEFYKSDACFIEFFNVVATNAIKVKKGKVVELRYVYNNIEIDVTQAQLVREIDLSAITRSNYLPAMFNIYDGTDLLALGIFRAWINGFSNFDWKDFVSEEKKRSWLRACLYWEKISQNNPVAREQIEIHGNQIICPEDLYCTLGENFFGYRGYIGQDLDGFDECLKAVVYNQNKKPQIKIYHHTDLENNFLSFPFHGQGSYKQHFMEILNDAGCVVSLL